MHRMLEESLQTAWETKRLSDWEGTNSQELATPRYDDLYREDPYRFEDDAETRTVSPADDLRRIDYIPTPAEIAGVCAEIRAGWTKSEKRRRFVGELPPEAFDDSAWAPPVIDTSHFRMAPSGVGEGA